MIKKLLIVSGIIAFSGSLVCAQTPKPMAKTFELGKGVTLELLPVAPGTFTMGRLADENEWLDDANQVQVTLSENFWLGKTEVTEAQYRAILGLPALANAHEGRFPVVDISWAEAMDFCDRLTKKARENGTLELGWKFTLPTEAQWEYACRAGTTTRFSFGDSLKDLVRYGNFYDSSCARLGGALPASVNTVADDGMPFLAPAASYLPNPWGFYDMHGNAWEWCLDAYRSELPGGKDPVVSGDETNAAVFRVLRGGGFFHTAEKCDSVTRICNRTDGRDECAGFRIALVREKTAAK